MIVENISDNDYLEILNIKEEGANKREDEINKKEIEKII